MAGDQFSEVTSRSWFSRLGGAIKGMIVGVILFLGSFVLLFWNEGRAVKTYKTLKEGAGAVVSVAAERVDSANEGRLVHVTGQTQTDETLADPIFGVSANALKLRRKVEMYQWEQQVESKTRKKVGGGEETVETYKYVKTWHEGLIDSSDFKQPSGHENPGTAAVESETFRAERVTLGAFVLSRGLLGKIGNFETLVVDPQIELPATLPNIQRYGSGFYVGGKPAQPAIGDLKVAFEVVKPGTVSVVSKQAGDSFQPYVAKTGKELELLQVGTHTAEAMFETAVKRNQTLTWVLRLVGFIVMMAGFGAFFKPLSVVADVLPVLGTIVEKGIGLVAFIVCASLTLVTIGIAWLVFRPLIGIILLVVAAGLLVPLKVLRKR
ncbi:MAG: TMEM43 family protein [Kiritimatiellae bacterium]|nr:TMEM43 family protein [Kiritimatiellia bacterium]